MRFPWAGRGGYFSCEDVSDGVARLGKKQLVAHRTTGVLCCFVSADLAGVCLCNDDGRICICKGLPEN